MSSATHAWVKLSDRAKRICEDHWHPVRTRCTGCPLLAPCTAPVRPMTVSSINSHISAVNEAAEKARRS